MKPQSGLKEALIFERPRVGDGRAQPTSVAARVKAAYASFSECIFGCGGAPGAALPWVTVTSVIPFALQPDHHHFVARALLHATVKIDRIGRCDPRLGAGTEICNAVSSCAHNWSRVDCKDRHLSARGSGQLDVRLS